MYTSNMRLFVVGLWALPPKIAEFPTKINTNACKRKYVCVVKHKHPLQGVPRCYELSTAKVNLDNFGGTMEKNKYI